MRRLAICLLIALAFVTTTLVSGPAADAAPIPITACGQPPINASGSYVLANNLTAGSGSACITITAEFVTIDLAGFSISCNIGALAGITTASAGHLRGIAVRNGSITNCLYGVDLSDARGSIVEELRVVGSRLDGIRANGLIRNNIAADNSDFGINVTPVGGVVINNYATGNDVGIGVDPGTTVVHNTANENRAGIGVGFHSTVIGNTTTNNTQTGIGAGCPSNLVDNTAVDNPFGNPNNINAPGDCHLEDNVAP